MSRKRGGDTNVSTSVEESKRIDDFVYSKSDGAMPGAREEGDGYFSVAPGYYRSRRFIPIMAGSQSRMMRRR